MMIHNERLLRDLIKKKKREECLEMEIDMRRKKIGLEEKEDKTKGCFGYIYTWERESIATDTLFTHTGGLRWKFL